MNKSAAAPPSLIDKTLAEAVRILPTRPITAKQLAQKVLAELPDQHDAMLIYGAASARLGDRPGATQVLTRLVKLKPDCADGHCELGLLQAQMGQSARSIISLRTAVALKPSAANAWRALGDPELAEAASALSIGRLDVAERILKQRAASQISNVPELRLLAEIALKINLLETAETLLIRAVELDPKVEPARHALAVALLRQDKAERAITELQKLLCDSPDNVKYLNLLANSLASVGEYSQAISITKKILDIDAKASSVWLRYGHYLRTSGLQSESLSAYKKCLQLTPEFGEAYFSLANMKTYRFSDSDVAGMEAVLKSKSLKVADRVHVEYALGKAMEDAREFKKSFKHYSLGAQLRRSTFKYDSKEVAGHVERCIKFFNKKFYDDRAGWGVDDQDPIFVIGLPRSGSTLVEQILASHSAVEGTMELHEIALIVRDFVRPRDSIEPETFPEPLIALKAPEIEALGGRYLKATNIQRKTAKPFFIDKMPNNFLHVGLLLLLFPKARIIDTRRNAMATGFSVFKQLFATGQNFSYDLTDIGLYYREYVKLIDHFDILFPGRIYRISHEDLVDDLESEVRRLLNYCELPFEKSTLTFYENDRAVRTASSEQVRQPIFRHGIDQWKNYEPWLVELKRALGPDLAH